VPGDMQKESVEESALGRTKIAGLIPRWRRNAVGEARGGWGMIPFMPRDHSAGDRERVKVLRLSVPARPLSGLRPSELEAAGSGLGGRGDFLFDFPPLLHNSETLMGPRLPITVCESS
jgi:hypothetical protein